MEVWLVPLLMLFLPFPPSRVGGGGIMGNEERPLRASRVVGYFSGSLTKQLSACDALCAVSGIDTNPVLYHYFSAFS